MVVRPETHFVTDYQRNKKVNNLGGPKPIPISEMDFLIDLDVFCAVMDRSEEKGKFLSA